MSKFLSEDRADQFTKGVAQNRDVLFAHNATVGPVTLLETNDKKIILGTSLTYYRCNEQHILPEFLVYEMRGRNFVRQYEQVMGQSTRNQVPITTQRKFFHFIPTLEQQRAIIKQATKVEKLSLIHISEPTRPY